MMSAADCQNNPAASTLPGQGNRFIGIFDRNHLANRHMIARLPCGSKNPLEQGAAIIAAHARFDGTQAEPPQGEIAAGQ